MGIYRVIERCTAFPNRTITFHQTRGPVIDLGAVLPGGALYLGDREAAEVAKAVIRSGREWPRVLAVMEASGWLPPARVDEIRSGLERQLVEERAARMVAEERLAALQTVVQILPAAPPEQPVPAAVSAAAGTAPQESAFEQAAKAAETQTQKPRGRKPAPTGGAS